MAHRTGESVNKPRIRRMTEQFDVIARRNKYLIMQQPTAWLMKQELMAAMEQRDAGKPQLAGWVEVDDAYLGGQRAGGRRGRGAAAKTPFVAAVETTAERKPRRLRLAVVKGFRKKEIAALAKRDFAAGSNVVSDGLILSLRNIDSPGL